VASPVFLCPFFDLKRVANMRNHQISLDTAIECDSMRTNRKRTFTEEGQRVALLNGNVFQSGRDLLRPYGITPNALVYCNLDVDSLY